MYMYLYTLCTRASLHASVHCMCGVCAYMGVWMWVLAIVCSGKFLLATRGGVLMARLIVVVDAHTVVKCTCPL